MPDKAHTRHTAATCDDAEPRRRLPSLCFRANFNDHFETSPRALRDVYAAVHELQQLTRPSAPDAFVLYDPYYCTGAVVQHWAALGLRHVLHANRDFYADVRNATVPRPYDMLVTNPPFSDDHIQRLLRFLTLQQTQPWAFLAPAYVATKPWYVQWVRTHYAPATTTTTAKARTRTRAHTTRVALASPPPLPPFLQQADDDNNNDDDNDVTSATHAAATASDGRVGVEPFYIVPRTRYDFAHPTGAGHAHSHFDSMWYVWAGQRTGEVLRGTRVALLRAAATRAPQQRSSCGGDNDDVRVTAPVVVHGLAALRDHLHASRTHGNKTTATTTTHMHGRKRARTSS